MGGDMKASKGPATLKLLYANACLNSKRVTIDSLDLSAMAVLLMCWSTI